MSDMREKLSEVLEGGFHSAGTTPYDSSHSIYFTEDKCKIIADYLIANGVTVQKWIPVSERLPEKEEYTAKSKNGTEYYVRLLIAYKTDIVEYEIGYYDGYKWLSEMPMRIIKDVIAWKQFESLPEPPKGE